MDQSGIFPHAHQPETEVDTQRDNCQTRETQSEVRWEVKCQDSGDPEHFSFFLMWPWGRWGLIIQTPPKSTIQIHASPAETGLRTGCLPGKQIRANAQGSARPGALQSHCSCPSTSCFLPCSHFPPFVSRAPTAELHGTSVKFPSNEIKGLGSPPTPTPRPSTPHLCMTH